LLVHSFVDFNLHILSNALLFFVQASLAVSPPLASARPGPREIHSPPSVAQQTV
jgi:hypothetical protein